MYINLLYLPLFKFAYLFFLSFPLNIFVSFIFIALFLNWHRASVFVFYFFQFVLWLVLFLTGKYNFWFPLFTRSIYCIFVGLFSLCSWVYMYMCICHYFNYYLPDFVTSICLVFLFCFLFWGICFISLNAIKNHLWNLHSWSEIKPWAFGVGALTPRP